MNYIKNYNSLYIVFSKTARIKNRLGITFKYLFVNISRKVILLLFVCVCEGRYLYVCVYVCICMCVMYQVCAGPYEDQKSIWDCLELELQAPWVTQHGCCVPDSTPLANGTHVTHQPSWPPTTNFLKWRILDFSPVLYTELHNSHDIINFPVLFLIF